jgi:hypothetical protein
MKLRKLSALAVAILLIFASSGTWASAAKLGASNYLWSGACEQDPFISKEWKPVQNYLKSVNYCDAPYTLVPATMPKSKPKSKITAASFLQDVSVCKLPNTREFQRTGFPNASNSSSYLTNRHPGVNTVFQVIPVQTQDAVAGSATPEQEYGKYFRYLEKFLEYMSDKPSNVEFRIPSKYFKMDVKLAEFNLGGHGFPTDKGRDFFKKAVKAIDDEVDFTGVNLGLLVIPGQSNYKLIGSQPWGQGVSAEGKIEGIASMTPNSAVLAIGDRDNLSTQPLGVLHGLYHTGFGLDDHYGDQRWQPGEGLGMANWGLMSTTKTDLLMWEKWIVGFTADSQVRCADAKKDSIHWIAPGGIKTKKEKLLVVPLSESRAIVVESVRSKGINYKLAKESRGALVYVVDTAEQRHGFGMNVVIPSNHRFVPESPSNPMVGSNAPLKLKESVTIDGVKIRVVEAGEYGDVIKVSPKP